MRAFILSISLMVAPTLAVAGTALRPVVDLAGLDKGCRVFASAPNNAGTPASALDAAVSVASCEVLARTHALVLTPTPVARDALEHAVRPSLALFDDVIARGDLAQRIVAQHAKADTYQGMAVLLASSVPRLAAGSSDLALSDHLQRVRYVDALTRTWRQRAEQAHREVAQLASEDPRLVAANPVIARVVADSQIDQAVAVR